MFSAKLGGPVEVNCRSFVDEVVVQLKHHLPLIGVKNWKEIPQEAKNTMKAKVLVCMEKLVVTTQIRNMIRSWTSMLIPNLYLILTRTN